MKKHKNMSKRLLAVVLSLLMTISLLPAAAIPVQAAENETRYISMPITIRDYAADGMLFEWNETGEEGDTVYGGTSYGYYALNPTRTNWPNNGNKGIRICTYGNDGWTYSSLYWLAIICDANGNVVKVLKNGESKGTASSGAYASAMKSGYYGVWVWNGDTENYNNLNVITESNKSNYKITYNTTAQTITVTQNGAGNGGTYHNANTKGFGLLQTDEKDKFNVLPNSDSISGTNLVTNGTWDSSSVTATTTTLSSGAKETVYGAYIRTDLVNAKLGEDKQLVYTEATVSYLADLLEKTLPVAWQNADGTYNMWHVMGAKLDDLGGTDLATKLRAQITGEKGTYADAKAKYEEGNLKDYTKVSTYYDAAYFLLHNTFSDSTGYGKTINDYHTLNLVEKVIDGKTTYVFNSAYDGVEYDKTTGTIYNTQTDTITARKNENGATQYVRGNVLPENRFDPISNLGYGKSGNTYTKARDNTQEAYYDNTNYNLTLEGHAQFIYYEDSDLYFNFTGDDDVYLFINGIRVLDMGGGHSISKAGISLNDVATLCGLKDGDIYDFDFYYMERHGTAANFGIETNIRIVDPSILTTKEGYQYGVSTGYNGYVDPLKSVGYEFGLKNNGDAAIENLTFEDDDIGVTLSKDVIKLNSETTMENLRATVYNADGTVKEYIEYGNLTEGKLKELLAAGLEIGEQIRIYGFMHKVTSDEWQAGNDTFPNRVYTSAESKGENASTKTLNGSADWKVQKKTYDYVGFHVYEWKGKGVTVTKDELLQPLKDAGTSFDTSGEIILCTAAGNTTAANLNPNAVLNSDGSVTYTGTETGVDSYYYKVKQGDEESKPIWVDIYSYDVADNTYVLDYGLAVELNGPEFGLMTNDTLNLEQNQFVTVSSVTGISDATSNYGAFNWDKDNSSLKYTPNKIMNDIDTVNVNVRVMENRATELTKFTGVDMTEKVTTAPANVVYYEEDFPGITYVNEGENQWAHYETVDEEGNSVAGTEQSADQNSNYGSDPNYEKDKTGEWNEGEVIGTTNFQLDTTDLDTLQASAIEELNQYLGLTGSDSNGTVNVLKVNETAEVMYFDFTGTGFEILSRTTDEQYAVITVTVYKDNGDGTYTVVEQKPVITESKGGDLYQVPIISITDLPRDNYRVSVKAAGSTETKTRVLYIDGIRIYGPLDDDKALEYYNPEEYQAEFMEVKQLIKDGKAIYADISDSGDETSLVTGTTMIEDVEKSGWVLTSIESPEKYMQVGPNNELYLDGNASTGVLAFFLTPDENTPEAARTIEVGAHRKVESVAEDNGYVDMVYGSTADAIIDGINTYTVSSGTEQYYTIDISKLTKDSNGRYLVMVGTNGSENGLTTLALTNLKVSGYVISMAEQQLQTAYAASILSDDPAVQQISMMAKARIAQMPQEPEEETEVTEPVNEALTIDSAALKATKIVSGKLATLSVKAGSEADSLVVTGPDGVVVEPTRSQKKQASDGTVTFMYMWTVTGNRGDVLDYSIRVYDASGLASVNTETVTVTIK